MAADCRHALAKQEHEELTEPYSEDEDEQKIAGCTKSTWRNLLIVALYLVVGHITRMTVQGEKFITSLDFIVQIVTTIGYGDLDVSRSLFVFLCFYVLIGLCVVATILNDISQSAVDSKVNCLRRCMRFVETFLDREVSTEKQAFSRYRAINKVLASFMLFMFFVLFGTVFYRLYESCACSYGVTKITGCMEGDSCYVTGGRQKSWLKAMYMSVITLTTVGFGDSSPATMMGRAIGVPWMLGGVVAAGTFVLNFASLLKGEELCKLDAHDFSKECFEAFDKYGEGHLDLLEFRCWALTKYGLADPKEFATFDRLFEKLDEDGLGVINLKTIMTHFHPPSVT